MREMAEENLLRADIDAEPPSRTRPLCGRSSAALSTRSRASAVPSRKPSPRPPAMVPAAGPPGSGASRASAAGQGWSAPRRRFTARGRRYPRGQARRRSRSGSGAARGIMALYRLRSSHRRSNGCGPGASSSPTSLRQCGQRIASSLIGSAQYGQWRASWRPSARRNTVAMSGERTRETKNHPMPVRLSLAA